MIDKPDSMLLLDEATKIGSFSFWKRYVREMETLRDDARQKCFERGDKEYEKGMVYAYDIILGYKDRHSLFQRLREGIVSKAGGSK